MISKILLHINSSSKLPSMCCMPNRGSTCSLSLSLLVQEQTRTGSELEEKIRRKKVSTKYNWLVAQA
jgi:hypothetical protein